jgi:hypothetical protein
VLSGEVGTSGEGRAAIISVVIWECPHASLAN